METKTRQNRAVITVGDIGIEPMTPSVSGKYATTAPTARVMLLQANFFVCLRGGYESRTRLYGFAGRCLTAWLTHRKVCQLIGPRADNGTRTRGLNLGKVALYQLSYVRMCLTRFSPAQSTSVYYTHKRVVRPAAACRFWCAVLDSSLMAEANIYDIKSTLL